MSDTPIQAPLFGVAQSHATKDDHYTPAWVFERMGIAFDLDVCSPPSGIPWIPAADGDVSLPTFLAAFGDECVEAIGRLGTVRVPL